MSKQLLLFFMVITTILVSTNSLAQFTDNFIDGDFTNNPNWTGNATDFQISTAFELQLNAPSITSTSYLVTASQAIGAAQYDFNVNLDFSPSTSNYARVYLTSSSSDLSGSLNGYFVQIGGATGTLDDVSLFYQDGNIITQIIDGIDGTVATNPNVNIRVTRDIIGNWELLIDTARNGVFTSEGTVLHTTITSSTYFGVYCKYTSTRSDKFFFNDFVISGGPILDIDPPTIDSIAVISATQLDVYFNEDVETSSSQTTSNYTLNNGINSPSNAILDGSNALLVHLTFSGNIPNNSYIITVNDVADLSNNTVVNTTKSFTVNIPVPYNYGDVIINEIFADPTPMVALPDAEFIELTNNTTANINLSQWQYSDASSQVTLPAYVIAPNAHVILCSQNDTSLFTNYGDVLGLSSWPTLNNSGDFLGLRDPLNNLIDTVPYTTTWYTDATKSSGGWTLERIHPTAPCSDANNWAASNNVNGGTPGSINAVFDNTPNNATPQIASYQIIGSSQIELSLNKALDSNTVSISNFTLNNGIAITSVFTPSFQTVILEVTPPLLDHLIYELDITGIADCYGNAISDTSFLIAIGKQPGKGDLVFNEIYASPTLDNPNIPNAEFVEIMNTTSEPIFLGGVTFSDQSTVVNLPNEVLLPSEIAILTEDLYANSYSSFGRVISLSSWPSLNNSEDVITLATATIEIDVIQYSDTWYNDTDKKSGWSLELINPTTTCIGKNNWNASTDNNQATPGEENSVYNPNFDIAFTLISASAISPTEIALVFSKTIDASTIAASQFIWSNGLTTDSTSIDITQTNLITLTVSPQLSNGQQYEVTATNILDCSGQHILDSTALVSLPEVQSMLINEILFNPNVGGSDYIELYNSTTANIDLKNWSLLYTSTSGDSAYKVITSTSYVVKSGEFVVLNEDSGNIQFEYPNHGSGTFLIMDLPTYANASGHVIVLNQMGLLNDEFIYSEDMHFELISDPKGVSLERVNYTVGANTSKNWHSAASTSYYGTPGLENSQFITNASASTEVTVSPKTFSPNNDGYKDVTSIAYNFEADGFVATVTIHNDQGQQVKNLINNQSIDAQGEITWDGTNENNQILPTGMYIVMFRIFNLENQQHVYKNVVVLAMP